jgi:formamidopyrimidine-DNA glycosylase
MNAHDAMAGVAGIDFQLNFTDIGTIPRRDDWGDRSGRARAGGGVGGALDGRGKGQTQDGATSDFAGNCPHEILFLISGVHHSKGGVRLKRMPELPDISAYLSALQERIVGQPLQRLRLGSPFLLRTAVPPISEAVGHQVTELRRIGKRVSLGLDNDLWLVLHLMIAGRLHWRATGAKLAGRNNLAAFDFPNGSLVLTEAGTKRRASLHVVKGEEALRSLDPGGIEVFGSDLAAFIAAMTAENRTLKRALTDPRILSGIGNAYSDEILHAAELSPVTLTSKLSPQEWERLFTATRETLRVWIDRLGAQSRKSFPEKVTAFRDGMAVHGRFGQPCPRCGEPVQRIRYADNETNYCAKCQTGGRVLADRALSRLLGADWPRTLDELEALKRR